MRGTPRLTLQSQLTPFVGRQADLDALDRLLADPQNRLITVTAPGGMGKTRLTLEFASRQAASYPGGAMFVPLAGASKAADVVNGIGEALFYTFPPMGDRTDHLLAHLNNLEWGRTLLVLDNFEQLLDSAPLLLDVLRAAPDIQVIVTSRERLNLGNEIVYELGGMDLPERFWPGGQRSNSGRPISGGVLQGTLEDWLAFDAVQLFVQAAQRAQPTFTPDMGHIPHIFRICRGVFGMPLGIVLAAAWIELMDVEEIAAEIERGLDFLETDARDIPDRQRSLRAVFEASWHKLDATEQDAFMKLSIFRGGVKRPIAQYVSGASLRTLMSLINKSLLRRDPESGRYEVHEMLRQFAAEQLENSGKASATRDIHSHYYISFISQRAEDLRGGRQMAAMTEISDDYENVRAALAWAIQHKNTDALDIALDGFFMYCLVSGLFDEGIDLLDQAATRFAPRAGQEPSLLWLRVVLRLELLRIPDGDRARIEAAMQSVTALGLPGEQALALRSLAYHVAGEGDFQAVIALMEGSLALYREAGDQFFEGALLSDIGLFYGVMGQREQSAAYLQRALDLQTQIGDEAGRVQTTSRNGVNVTLRDPGSS